MGVSFPADDFQDLASELDPRNTGYLPYKGSLRFYFFRMKFYFRAEPQLNLIKKVWSRSLTSRKFFLSFEYFMD